MNPGMVSDRGSARRSRRSLSRFLPCSENGAHSLSTQQEITKSFSSRGDHPQHQRTGKRIHADSPGFMVHVRGAPLQLPPARPQRPPKCPNISGRQSINFVSNAEGDSRLLRTVFSSRFMNSVRNQIASSADDIPHQHCARWVKWQF